jgi:hypothetical protein
MEYTEKSIRKILVQSGLWLFVSVAVATSAAFLPLYPSSETQGVVVKLNWPQISGHSNNSVLPSQASYPRYERAA